MKGEASHSTVRSSSPASLPKERLCTPRSHGLLFFPLNLTCATCITVDLQRVTHQGLHELGTGDLALSIQGSQDQVFKQGENKLTHERCAPKDQLSPAVINQSKAAIIHARMISLPRRPPSLLTIKTVKAKSKKQIFFVLDRPTIIFIYFLC